MPSNQISRRALLGSLGATTIAGVGCSPAAPPASPSTAAATPASTAAPAPAPPAESEETRMTSREGTLIKLEGLIAYSLLQHMTSVLAVDAYLVDATENKALKLHRHASSIAIPRDVLPMDAEGMTAVDLHYAYWTLDERRVSISPSEMKSGVIIDTTTPKSPAPETPEEWRSMGWVADFKTLYSGHKVEPPGKSVAGVVRFLGGAEFEPKGIAYGDADKPNYVWLLFKDSSETPVHPARAYKHSAHVFFEGAKGIVIKGLQGSAELTLPASKLKRPIRICHLPARAQTPEELEYAKDARAYAEFLEPNVPLADRLFPKRDSRSVARAFKRTDGCGCCPSFRSVRELKSDDLPPL